MTGIDQIESSDEPTGWVAPRLIPLSALHQAEVGISTGFPEFTACDTTYAPAS